MKYKRVLYLFDKNGEQLGERKEEIFEDYNIMQNEILSYLDKKSKDNNITLTILSGKFDDFACFSNTHNFSLFWKTIYR